jgi:hypothetical protein
LQLSSLYLAKVLAILDFFKEFLRIFIQEISKFPNFGKKNSVVMRVIEIVWEIER